MNRVSIWGIFILALLISSCGRDKVKKQTDQDYSIGQSKMEIKDYTGAIVAFNKCTNLNPGNYDAYHQKALAYKALNNKKNALYNYRKAVTIMETKEDLTDPNKKAEYNSLLQELKEYSDAQAVPVPPVSGPPATGTVNDTSKH
jgi:Tfp pilus assembly protein PilF